MDKKGEIDYLTKIVRPDISVITNINYAHAKNFNNIRQIALAKSEIIKNTKANGFIVLNADDKFFKLHKKMAYDNNINVISFGIKSNKSDIKFLGIKRKEKLFALNVLIKNIKRYFLISNEFQSNIYNILATLAVMSIDFDINKIKRISSLILKILKAGAIFQK